jgi:hypothetical protein
MHNKMVKRCFETKAKNCFELFCLKQEMHQKREISVLFVSKKGATVKWNGLRPIKVYGKSVNKRQNSIRWTRGTAPAMD